MIFCHLRRMIYILQSDVIQSIRHRGALFRFNQAIGHCAILVYFEFFDDWIWGER